MQRNALQVILAIVLVLWAGYYWSPGGNPEADPETVERQMALAQTYLYETRSWEYDDDGALTEVLEASQAEYFKRGNVSELTQPRFYSHDGNDRTWSAEAAKGRLRHNRGLLILRRDVRLANDQTGGTLVSEAMTVDVNRKIARSRVPVTVTYNGSSIQADGMEADLNKERIVMEPNVESTYVERLP